MEMVESSGRSENMRDGDGVLAPPASLSQEPSGIDVKKQDKEDDEKK